MLKQQGNEMSKTTVLHALRALRQELECYQYNLRKGYYNGSKETEVAELVTELEQAVRELEAQA